MRLSSRERGRWKVFLTESYAEGDGWRASANNNGSGDVATMKSVVIGIQDFLTYPDGSPFGYMSIVSDISGTTNGPAGYQKYSGSGVNG